MRDPFYREIVAALEAKRFDPQIFERCMGNLLLDRLPGLVPIPGGSDAGMDGAIFDGQGEAYPLVCTSDDDVIGNLTKSLESYVAHGGQRRQVVLATSLELTSLRRRNLEERAREKGFTLVQVFERRAIADRLYYSERWSRELLALAWKPQALSPVPPTGRTQLEIDLIGRDADVEWLRTTSGDRLITGQPGSGKTFLLHHLAREGWGVFLRSEDPGEIRYALCEQQPEIVIVDDAHEHLHRIQMLRDVRQEVGQDFAIAAACWEGERDDIAEALGSLPAAQIRRLELLTRDQILEVIRQTGVQASPEFLRELVSQAKNKPGLAVTLATLCLRGSWSEVLKGETLARSLMTDFRKLVGEESSDFLATLSVGGDRGMPLEAAGDFLGISKHRAHELAKQLAIGGVLSEVRERVLAVWPVALRSALLRQVFFEEPVKRDYRPLLEHAESFENATKAIVTAADYGAEVPPQDLRSLVERCRSRDVWSDYAALGENQAQWALQQYPGDLVDIAEDALFRAPSATISRLLELAGFEDASAVRSKQILQPLSGWMHEMRMLGELIDRRKRAVRLAKGYVEKGGARWVAIRVLQMALSLRLRSTSRDPGSGRTVTVRQGILPLDPLRELQDIWEEGRQVIGQIDAETWNCLSELSWDWIYPHAVGYTAVPPAILDAIRSLAHKLLRSLAPLAEGSPGLAAGLTHLANRVGLDLRLPTDPLFDVFYPADPAGASELREGPADAPPALEDLARQWRSERQPREILEKLTWYENEAARIGRQQGRRRTPELCSLLAAKAGDLREWVELGLDLQLPVDLLRPFLESLVETRSSGWKTLLARCLELEPQAWEAVRLALTLRNPPPDLLEAALDKATAYPQLIETLCLRNEVPLATLQALLGRPEPQAALAAAVGAWLANPRSQMPEGAHSEWRQAILESARQIGDEWLDSFEGGLGYWLGEILSSDAELSREWLEILMKLDPALASHVRGVLNKALGALREAQRLEILERLEPGRWAEALLPGLVSRDVTVYRRLLELERLRDYHLRPLAGRPDAKWEALAKMALAAGHEPRAVAWASFPREYGWIGDKIRPFASLEDHPDEDLREVARYAQELVQEDVRNVAVRQRQLELDGF